MNLLVYSPQADNDESRLLQAARCHDVQVVRTQEALIARLNELPGDHGVSMVILLITGVTPLERLVEARDCFSDRALILILPEEESFLTSSVFQLRATYLGFRGGTFDDVAAVIARIQKRIVRKKKNGPQEMEEPR